MSLSVQEKLEAGPMFDMPIVEYHFTSYMRDYDIFVDVIGAAPDGHKSQVMGRSRYRFTHCVLAEVTTTVSDEIWMLSWSKDFINNQAYLDAGEPEGYVWGVNWMNAYPGLSYIANSPEEQSWADRLKKPMHEALIETNTHKIELIFHDVEITWTSEGSSAK